MPIFLPDSKQEFTAQSTGFNLFGTLSWPRKIGISTHRCKKTFNDINRIRMLWIVRHLCPPRARFVSLLLSVVITFFAEQEWDGHFSAQQGGSVTGGPNRYGCLRYIHPPTDQTPERRIYWRHLALVCWKWRCIRYVWKSQVIFQFVKTTWGHRMRVLPWTL